MKKLIKKILFVLNLWRIFPVFISVLLLNKTKRRRIKDELLHWGKCSRINAKGIYLMGTLLLEKKEYRNLLCYRLKMGKNYIRYGIAKFLFPNMESLYIVCQSIGDRLYIQHGFATVIAAKSIGSDCWINQQVTIGYSFDDEPPVIGNGVRISAGAKVIGQISIGDNAIVAANAAVVKDVESNMVVGGVPAKVIGENKEHKLYVPKS